MSDTLYIPLPEAVVYIPLLLLCPSIALVLVLGILLLLPIVVCFLPRITGALLRFVSTGFDEA